MGKTSQGEWSAVDGVFVQHFVQTHSLTDLSGGPMDSTKLCGVTVPSHSGLLHARVAVANTVIDDMCFRSKESPQVLTSVHRNTRFTGKTKKPTRSNTPAIQGCTLASASSSTGLSAFVADLPFN